jgi:hypothetical protein
MDLSHPRNAKLLTYVRGKAGSKPPFAWHRFDSEQAYYEAGCHPDVVERLWGEIGGALALDCRSMVYGTPALTHPTSGVVLALGMGTAYALRLTGADRPLALQAGAKLSVSWSGGGGTDIAQELGDDWVFGAWLASEPDWCRRTFEALG